MITSFGLDPAAGCVVTGMYEGLWSSSGRDNGYYIGKT